MIRWFYERRLQRSLTVLPREICFMITEEDMIEAPQKIVEVAGWCRDAGLEAATFHISTDDPGRIAPCLPEIRKIASIGRLNLHIGDRIETTGEGMNVIVAVGKSGREEIAACIRNIAAEEICADEIDEAVIERHLTFRCAPDLVIKTGGNYLTDFLIWQSVYSEFFFLDVNWTLFRKIDFLRALRDFGARKRRFGA
ncbi:undecaprenyl diphosphate synthase family protein [Methanofollis tationis]|jgi:undecaprenyl diphosphate synthase|uniref:Undecaprenyl diphosphate synthase family protein n=1 Tax=Methanofollis tationis TaxID=81417 RepID=A0A7K4HKZ0_9EURY|nr:undecaprenyl diphosphate synthase family protein [Methanofollis tationis]NVO65944.1 undecaprenyl diphosphate synthase family protein [Methanofollis tationis]